MVGILLLGEHCSCGFGCEKCSHHTLGTEFIHRAGFWTHHEFVNMLDGAPHVFPAFCPVRSITARVGCYRGLQLFNGASQFLFHWTHPCGQRNALCSWCEKAGPVDETPSP